MRPSRIVGAACSAVLTASLLTLAPIATQAEAVPAPRDPQTPTIPQRYLDQPVTWTTCSFDAAVKRLYPQAPTTNCAKVKVPMDWADPDAHPDVEVAIAYSEATGTSRGLMMTNPGGPGGAGLTLSASLAIDKPQLFSDYDLVGLDPRGFGQSTPLQCLTTTEKLNALPTTPDYKERTAQTHATELAEAELLAEACSATEFGQFVSSQQTVFDMEFVRALLESEKLNFIGYSYGTWLGGWYADTYPARVDRFVIDSNMDWTRTQWENVNFDPFSGQRRRDAQLFPWIARQAASGDITGLGTSPAAVTRKYDQIRTGLTDLVKAGRSEVSGDNLDGSIYSAIYGNTRFIRATLDILVHDEFVADPSTSGAVEARHVDRAWARLSPELQAFDTLAATRSRYGITAATTAFGSPATAAATQVESIRDVIADARETAASSRSSDATVSLGAVSTTVRCNDTRWDKAPRFYQLEADKMARKYPFFGYMNGVPMCAYWDYEPQDRKLDLPGSAPLLMIQAEFDPATAYEGAWRTHAATPRTTRFIAIDEEGQHGQYIGSPSACAEAIGDAFVFDGVLPGEDQVCRTSPLPNETKVFEVNGPVEGNTVRLPPSKQTGLRPAQPNPMLQQNLDMVAAGALR